jgi:ABC-type ATPase with predicted acetyltransferase domain
MPRTRLTRDALRARFVQRAFGLAPIATPSRAERDAESTRIARHVLSTLAPGAIAFITGPSGAGKSLALRAIARLAGSRNVVRAIDPRRSSRAPSVVSAVARQFRGPLESTTRRAISILSHAGLAEASLLLRHPRTLSDGQSFRLSLAIAMARTQTRTPRSPTLLVDEFCSTLDTPTAARVCRTLRRWARLSRARVVVCGARDELMEWLAPDLLIHVRTHAPVEFHAAA